MRDAGLSVRAFFTTRHGGYSEGPYASLNVGDHVGDAADAVRANRARVAEHAGAPVTFLRPTHGRDVALIEVAGAEAPEADILVTATPGVALATLGADCVPLVMHDGATGAVAAAHIGRRGLVEGTVDATVAALLSLRGAHGGLLSAVVGPAICAACYEVPEAMRDEAAHLHPAAWATTRQGTPALDIPGAVAARLEMRGVTVTRHGACTAEDPDYFSHRRDGVTGRHAGVIVCGSRGVSLRGEKP